MAKFNAFVRRIFGKGAYNGAQPTGNWRAEDQALGETLGVGTVRRMFKGPQRNGNWSYGGRATAAGGAGSQLKFYYSDLPEPDPASLTEWVDSGITAVPLTATTAFRGDLTGKFPEWILAEVVIGTTPGDVYLWVRSEGVEV